MVQISKARLDIDREPLKRSEIKTSIGKVRGNKAAGRDGVPVEIFKVFLDKITLEKLLTRIWEEEREPNEWLLGIIEVKLQK